MNGGFFPSVREYSTLYGLSARRQALLPDHAVVTEGDADLVAVARAMLYDPRWPWHAAAELGAVIMPPVPAFYHRPQSLDDVINQTVNRVLDQFDIDLPEDLFTRWQGA